MYTGEWVLDPSKDKASGCVNFPGAQALADFVRSKGVKKGQTLTIHVAAETSPATLVPVTKELKKLLSNWRVDQSGLILTFQPN